MSETISVCQYPCSPPLWHTIHTSASSLMLEEHADRGVANTADRRDLLTSQCTAPTSLCKLSLFLLPDNELKSLKTQEIKDSRRRTPGSLHARLEQISHTYDIYEQMHVYINLYVNICTYVHIYRSVLHICTNTVK